MATVSGSVLFNSANASPTTGAGVANIPIVLRNTSNGMGLTVLTDVNGTFTFNNVPNASYQLSESWGVTGGVATPGNFTNAVLMNTSPPKADPPITAMPSPPTEANATQSLSPNLITLSVSGSNITGQNFVDGPITTRSATLNDVTLAGGNLITVADNGTWGTIMNGSPVNSSPATEPYGAISGVPVAGNMSYQQMSDSTPGNNGYSVTNINTFNQGTFWLCMAAANVPRDETNRFQIVNGDTAGLVFFQQVMNVTANSYYYANFWLADVFAYQGFRQMQPGVRIRDLASNTIFEYIFPSMNASNIPTWMQLNTFFNVGNNTQVRFQLVDYASSGAGNVMAIDDIVMQSGTPNTIFIDTKTVDKEYADVGDTLNYTVVLNNTGQSIAKNISFQDTIPNGATFNTGSVKINGTTFGAFNPTTGFTLTSPATIGAGQLTTITYSANVTTIPVPNPIIGTARTSYTFTPVTGGVDITQTILSNNTTTTISSATISATKYRDLYATLGSVITYTIPISVSGNTIANNVVLIDTIPSQTTFVDNSVIIDGVTKNGLSPAPPNGINLGTIANGTTSTVSFKVLVSTIPTINSIYNSAFISYNYTVDPTMPLGKSGAYNTNIVTSQFNLATLSSTKIVNTAFANLGDILTYTIAITNSGNVSANNILFIDTIPNGTSMVTNSFKQDTTTISGSPNYPGITLPNIIGIGKTTSVTFKVTVNSIPSPNPIQNKANINYTYTFNPSIANSGSGVTNTNTVNTQVNHATFEGITKYVDKIFSYMGDTITYTIVAPNSGNITAVNVIFRDTIPNGTTFITNSVTTNGIIMNGVSPVSGITLPDISPGGVGTITFKVLVG